MKLAIVTTELAERQDLHGGPIDAEWIVAATAEHELHVFADQESPGLESVRKAGVEVAVSPQRPMTLDGSGTVSSDAYQASIMVAEHERSAFDAILYEGTAGTDYGWFRAELEDIPRGVVLGSGPLADHRLILGDAGAFVANSHRIWAATGVLATADFVVSDAPPEAYGISSPPIERRSTRAPVEPVRQIDEPPGLVALVALFEDLTGLASLIPRLLEQIPAAPETTIAVIHRRFHLMGRSTRDAILASASGDLERRIVLIPPGSDGAASRMLRVADLVVASTRADCATPAVADRATSVPLIILDDSPVAQTLPLTAGAIRRPPAHSVMLTFSDAPGLARSLRALEADDVDMAFVHDADGASAAARLHGLGLPVGADLVTSTETDPLFGSADPTRVNPHVIGLSRAIWPTVHRRLEGEPSLWDLMVRLLGPSGVEYATLLSVPGLESGHRELPMSEMEGFATWVPAHPMLTRPNLLDVPWMQPGPHDDASASVREWAKQHTWSDRVRLALPWRFGLLRRAMKDRW